MKEDIRKYVAEFLGTFMLVFFAAGAVMAAAAMGSQSGALIAGIASGLILMIVVWIFIGTSGGHVNPSLSLALVLLGLFPRRLLAGYMISQLAGSAAAGLTLAWALGDVGQMGANLPNIAAGIGPMKAIAIEFILSFVMMLVIMGATSAGERIAPFAAVPIGAIVGIEVMLFGGLAGAAMNPARAFGPYLALGDWTHFWIYVAGPTLGILVAGWSFLRLTPSNLG